jgi:hypothetical protein
MDKSIIREYIKENLTLEIHEKMHGFNGEHVDIRLVLEGETISADIIETKRDEG